ncbi:unnamed protein product [Ambrosiozyma monospora]|uniref:Unnamed protein product n=1 Tax=Ambrosiozyma monospora TaxID=43982 RepID=A0ACB5TEC5_AMBMO|nr:unnamed protein product [Ambrosiozyma monospora]
MTSENFHKVVHEANNIKARPTPKAFYEKQPNKSISTLEEYKTMYKQSIEDPENFWGPMAKKFLDWDKDFYKVKTGSLANGDAAWFVGGELNASFNCVDRHAFKNPNKTAIIFEADNEEASKKLTYGELLREVSRVAGVLKSWGIKKGDTVGVYLPMTAEALIAMLAVARLGRYHL